MSAAERDAIDDLIAAWEREGEGIEPASIGIVSRIWYLAKLFGEDRRRTLAAADLDPAILDLLSVLRRAGPPYRLSTRELAARSLVTAGAISQRLSRAEAAGLIERQVTSGSRVVEVQLTELGQEVGIAALRTVLEREQELLKGISIEQRKDLERLLRTLLHVVTSSVDGLSRTQVGT